MTTEKSELDFVIADAPQMNGRRVLVTGAGTGIGRGIALEFAREGADVALHYYNEEEGVSSAVETILKAGGKAEKFQELRGNDYNLIMGDFNSLSPEDKIPASAVASFSERMKEKYCRDGKLCYDTIEAVLNEGYVDVGLKFHAPDEITDKTDLSGGTGNHTRPMRMDFFFATKEVLPYVKEFVMVKEGLARTASDHFPWYVVLDESLFHAE